MQFIKKPHLTSIFKPLILLLLCLSTWAFNHVLDVLIKKESRPRVISFKLPIDPDTAAKAGLPQSPDIERIVLAGFFSDWNPADSRYELKKVSAELWTISRGFEPGVNQYKFVVYTRGAEKPVWVHDWNNPSHVPDSFGGYNSVLTVPDFSRGRRMMNAILFALIAVSALYLLLGPVIRAVMRLRLRFRYKLLLSVALLGLIANMALIVYNVSETRAIVRQGLIDSLNLVHNFIQSEGVDFSLLYSITEQEKLALSIRKFFRGSRTRVEKNKHSPAQVTLSDLLFLSPGLDVIAFVPRRENEELQNTRARNYGFGDALSYFRYGVLSNLAADALASSSRALMTGRVPARLLSRETPQTRWSIALLGFHTFLYPVYVNGQLAGYYAGDIQTKLYGGEIGRILLFNLYLLAVLAVLSVLMLNYVGGIVTGQLQVLKDWTDRIIAGDLDTEQAVESHDEMELLAQNFNRMRQGLKIGFEAIEENNRRLQAEAYTDKLTGLPNRKRLLSDLEAGGYGAMILFNIDTFQELNDFYGNDVGDQILVEMSGRIRNLVLSEDQKVYALGGDEFVVLFMRALDPRELEIMAVYYSDGIMESSYTIEENEIYVSVTAGLALSDRTSSRSILAHADMALKKAKTGQRRYLCYDESMEITREYAYNMLWTSKLKEAIKEDRIVPYFQPIVDNLTGEISKYECLARLIESDGSVINPDRFIRLAKKARFYRFITRAMVEKSMAVFRSLKTGFSINLSIEDILDEKTQSFLFDRFRENAELSGRMVIEIVETEGIENYPLVRDFISSVRTLGIQVAIDDFGAGYSNFEHVMQLQVDYIKLDSVLIKNLDNDPSARVIVSTIAHFAHDLGIKTIAEYVHSAAVLERVREFGIDFSQGYYFGEPRPHVKN